MYSEFYGFHEKPFTITPNPRFIFLSRNHREAFAHLLYGIDNHSGFIELTGEVGTGKTTVLRTLLEQLDERGVRTAFIFNPRLSALELMRSINREFGIPWEGLSNADLLERLYDFLLSENRAGRTVVLVIDEAQNLDPQVLEQVRLISNLETKTDKLIQIVLAGQPELKQLLDKPELRQIAQRITVSYHLSPLDPADTKAYIEHRLEVAGDFRAATFTPEALKRVYRYAGGVPRLVNILCDRALLFGYIGESREITGRMVRDAIAEIRRETRAPSPRKRRILVAVLGLAIMLAAVVLAGRKALTVTAGTEASPEPSPTLALPETLTAGYAMNVLLREWHLPEAGALVQDPKDFERAAAQGEMRLLRFRGNLGRLVRLGYPAVLEVRSPGRSGKLYLPLTGVEQERYLVQVPSGRLRLTWRDLEALWTGNAFIIWKDYYGLSGWAAPGATGKKTAVLQKLLRDSGVYTGEITGSLGVRTATAISALQERHGIEPDPSAGPQTLLLLYRNGKELKVPVLEKAAGHGAET